MTKNSATEYLSYLRNPDHSRTADFDTKAIGLETYEHNEQYKHARSGLIRLFNELTTFDLVFALRDAIEREDILATQAAAEQLAIRGEGNLLMETLAGQSTSGALIAAMEQTLQRHKGMSDRLAQITSDSNLSRAQQKRDEYATMNDFLRALTSKQIISMKPSTLASIIEIISDLLGERDPDGLIRQMTAAQISTINETYEAEEIMRNVAIPVRLLFGLTGKQTDK